MVIKNEDQSPVIDGYTLPDDLNKNGVYDFREKGTQAEIIKQEYDLFHISTGDVFRNNIKNNTDLGLLAKGYMNKGELVPDEITINMLSEVVEKNIHVNGFIFDGFPRTESQAIALDKLLGKFNTSISGMIALEVSDEILINRLLERGKGSGRADDSNRKIIALVMSAT